MEARINTPMMLFRKGEEKRLFHSQWIACLNFIGQRVLVALGRSQSPKVQSRPIAKLGKGFAGGLGQEKRAQHTESQR
jgi:hypothetical protein